MGQGKGNAWQCMAMQNSVSVESSHFPSISRPFSSSAPPIFRFDFNSPVRCFLFNTFLLVVTSVDPLVHSLIDLTCVLPGFGLGILLSRLLYSYYSYYSSTAPGKHSFPLSLMLG